MQRAPEAHTRRIGLEKISKMLKVDTAPQAYASHVHWSSAVGRAVSNELHLAGMCVHTADFVRVAHLWTSTTVFSCHFASSREKFTHL